MINSNKREKLEIDMSKIAFRHISFNTLRLYMTGRRLHFNCRLNLWTHYVISIGVFYRDVLCGGVLVSRKDDGIAYIETWYSREDRAKLELLKHVEAIIFSLGYEQIVLPIQQKWISKLLNDNWKQDGKIAYKRRIENEGIKG